MARRLGLVAAALMLVAAIVPWRATAAGPKADRTPTPTVEASWFGWVTPPLPPGQIEVAVVSSLPSTVTGEDARIAVRGVQPDDTLSVDIDGTDVTASLGPDHSGVVKGFKRGRNLLTAIATGSAGTRRATLEVTDHAITGPVISGPQQTPFVCQTEASGLGKPLDNNCSVATRADWYARSVTSRFNKLDDPYAPYPPDTATTTTMDGKTVPFVVRVESSTINRSITRIAVLDDPHARGKNKPYAPSAGWNHRLVDSLGENCEAGHRQGVNGPDNALGQISPSSNPYENAFAPFLDLGTQLGKGYMTVHSTLSVLGVDCNDVINAETTMMVKEHVIEAYGPLVHFIGAGASGGAIQQHGIANNYPGLIDGGTPIIGFPDMVTNYMSLGDCVLLNRVFNADPVRWDELKKRAVLGHTTSRICADWEQGFAFLLDPRKCDAAIPPAMVYDPKKNPGGARCTIQDNQVNVWGKDPATGFARRPLDNTGLQYGLAALRAGTISAQDFVDLNKAVGGIDIDGAHETNRMAMDADVARIAYDTGRLTGRGAIDQAPMIDNQPNLDWMPVMDVHDAARPLQMRARMDRNLGGHGAQSIWQGAPYPADGFEPLEEWLTNVEHQGWDTSASSRAAAVASTQPASAADRCTAPKGVGIPGTEPCQSILASSPRMAAGGPPTEDVIKCNLKPIDAADYGGKLSAPDLAAVKAAFPSGVCNWKVAGVGETPRTRVWLSFGDGTRPPTPVPLKNVVARSAGPTTQVLGASVSAAASGGLTQLPETGGNERWALLAFAFLVGAIALRGHRSHRVT